MSLEESRQRTLTVLERIEAMLHEEQSLASISPDEEDQEIDNIMHGRAIEQQNSPEAVSIQGYATPVITRNIGS